MSGKNDARKERKGGIKTCQNCPTTFEAFRDTDKYCSSKCRNAVNVTRYWKKKLGL